MKGYLINNPFASNQAKRPATQYSTNVHPGMISNVNTGQMHIKKNTSQQRGKSTSQTRRPNTMRSRERPSSNMQTAQTTSYSSRNFPQKYQTSKSNISLTGLNRQSQASLVETDQSQKQIQTNNSVQQPLINNFSYTTQQAQTPSGYPRQSTFSLAQAAAKKSTVKARQNRSVTPRRQNLDLNNGQEPKSAETSFRVCVRIRPLVNRELRHVPTYARSSNSIIKTYGPQNTQIVHIYDSDLIYDHTGVRDRQFAFDEVFDDRKTNIEVFQSILGPLIPTLKQGYNVTCFAYGMTGAGKTHTMFGSAVVGKGQTNVGEEGIANLSIRALFADAAANATVSVSFLEIYNEQVKDLLSQQPGNENSNLMILEDPQRGVLVQDLSEYQVENARSLEKLIKFGNERRTVAATGANQASSRSHAILVFNVVTPNEKHPDLPPYSAKLQIVDLAGSERAQASDNRGQRMIEGANINKSLLALGNCINALSEKKANPSGFVCYRDSKLTRLLKDSLGGNTKTVMLGCISQFYASYEETMNTLKYAQRAKQIRNTVHRNYVESRIRDTFNQQTHDEAMQRQKKIHEVEVQESQSMIHEYGSVIYELQNQVQSLTSQLNSQHTESERRHQEKIRELMEAQRQAEGQYGTDQADRPGPSATQTPSQRPSDAQTTQAGYSQRNSDASDLRPPVRLSHEEELVYTHLKKQDGAPGNLLGAQLSEAYEKLVQNFEEEGALQRQIEELEGSLAKNKQQLVVNSKVLEQRQLALKLGHRTSADSSETGPRNQAEMDAKLQQMKDNEVRLLRQSIETNQHVLSQMNQALEVNQHQRDQLREYITQKLPTLFMNVLNRCQYDASARPAQASKDHLSQLRLLQQREKEKDEAIMRLQQQVIQLQQQQHAQQSVPLSAQPPPKRAAPPSSAQQHSQSNQSAVQQIQAANHQQNSSLVSSKKAGVRNPKLVRYLSNPRLLEVEHQPAPDSRQAPHHPHLALKQEQLTTAGQDESSNIKQELQIGQSKSTNLLGNQKSDSTCSQENRNDSNLNTRAHRGEAGARQDIGQLPQQNMPDQAKSMPKSYRSDSRQKFINAFTPVSRVNIAATTNDFNKMGSDLRRNIHREAPREEDSLLHDSSQVESLQQSAFKPLQNVPPVLKDFKPYAQVRRESKQRQQDSHRSLVGTPDKGVAVVSALSLPNVANTLQGASATNENLHTQLNSIERELRRQRDADSQRRGIQPPEVQGQHPRFNSNYKAAQTIQSSQFNIEHERNRAHYASVTAMPDADSMTFPQLREDASDMEETRRQGGLVKHLNLASLTMTKPGTQRHGGSARMHDDTSEEEMTQMSCGLNVRENFHGQSAGTSSNLATSRSGALLSSRRAQEAQPHLGCTLTADQLIDTTAKKTTGPVLSHLRLVSQTDDDGEPITRRTQHHTLQQAQQLLQTSQSQSLKESNIMTYSSCTQRDPGMTQSQLSRRDQVTNQSFQSARGPTTPIKNIVTSLTELQERKYAPFIQPVPPTEPSEMQEYTARAYRKDDGAAASKSPDRTTNGLDSCHPSPKINQDAVERLLAQSVTTNQRRNTDKLLQKVAYRQLPSEQSQSDIVDFPMLKMFGNHSQNMEMSGTGSQETSQVIHDWNRVLQDQSHSAILAFGEEDPTSAKSYPQTERTERATRRDYDLT